MMRIEVNQIGGGLHPEEVVVSVATREGSAELAVDRSSLKGTSISVGWPVGQEGDFYLVELPRETFQGYWRVWVPKSSVTRDEQRSMVPA